MLATVARWESKRIMRRSPGIHGLLALIVFPLLFLAPWHRIGLFSGSFEASLVLSALYVFMLGSNLGAQTGEFDAEAFWLFQKGVSIPDYALARLITAYAWGFVFSLAAMALSCLGIALHGDLEGRHIIVIASIISILYLIIQAVYFLLGALGTTRKSEVIAVLVIATFAQDLLLQKTGAAIRRAVHFGLPPLQDAFSMASFVANSDWKNAIASFLHILSFLVVCIMAASMLHRRWRPLFRS